MDGSDPRPVPEHALDELIRGFVEGGYAPAGADIEDDRSDATHGHGHGHGHGDGDGDGDGSVRETTYRGHTVRVITRYEVTIDGEQWDEQMHVQDDGSVIYHGLPQYAVPSALDLIRGVIDHSYEAPEEIRSAIRAAHEEA